VYLPFQDGKEWKAKTVECENNDEFREKLRLGKRDGRTRFGKLIYFGVRYSPEFPIGKEGSSLGGKQCEQYKQYDYFLIRFRDCFHIANVLLGYSPT
jgi:hypothetical protein